MAGVNKVMLLGRLGKDPEVRTLESGSKLATVSLATGKSYKDQAGEWQEKTEWHRLTFWRENADRAERLKKGDQVYVEGELSTRSWEQDNVTRYVTEIVVNYSQIIDRNSNGGSGGVPPITEEPFIIKPTEKPPVSPDLGGSTNPEDDLPF